MEQKSNGEIKEKIRHLINRIRYYDKMYYVNNQSIISDVDYDILRNELEYLEEQYPQLIESDSPTQNVGFFSKANNLICRKHNIPMLSLKNTYVLEDIIKFINKDDLWPVIIEPKLDGISLSLRYVDSYLSYALLRGDGKEGEDILDRIIYIKTIPMQLNETISCEVRGELYITKKNFLLLNEYKAKRGDKLFQNSRNATSGIVRYKGKYTDIYEYISFTPYNILNDTGHFYCTQTETLTKLQNLGFAPQIHAIAETDNNLEQSIKKVIKLTEQVQDMDGVVIKTNDLIKMHTLGSTNHHPLGAIAYKFTTNTKETKVEKILWTNSRNGKLTPVALITPINLDNANITRITLHNKKYLQEKQIGVGSILLIERVGSTVPQVKKVIKTSDNMEKLHKCPYCATTLVEDESNYLCPNTKCEIRIIENLCYFCKMMKMKGLGTKSIMKLTKYIQKPSELINFILTVPNMNAIGWEKFRFNFLKDVKNIDTVTILVSLGVENLSHQGISKIMEHLNITTFKSLIEFLHKENYKDEILSMNIFGIGKEKIQCFMEFIHNNKEEICNIISSLLKITH